MKEVQLQPGDHRAIRRVAEELQIFEGIQYKHLIRYYGLEIHRVSCICICNIYEIFLFLITYKKYWIINILQEEMLIFMEFCAEGTLESLIAGSENGLSESLIRKYTYQLVSAVVTLHSHGIVHRDIKRMSYNFIT